MNRTRQVVASVLVTFPLLVVAAGDLPTKFSNIGSIVNTRHNMTQRQPDGGGPRAIKMEDYRNDYGEVCVYCHTPHGANTQTTAPLWNRTMTATPYTTYDQLGTASLTPGSVSQPGTASLMCLSCHDGQVAIDSVINMPGSGRYRKEQETTVSKTFLDSWPPANSYGINHLTMTECMTCHSTAFGSNPGATDFSVAIIGTDLRNDHPVGVIFPINNTIDFNTPGRIQGNSRYFDKNGNHDIDATEIRLYNGKVECASCHDPHGVPKDGNRSATAELTRTFLRMSNAESGLCLTCHIK